jgi:hypothetical protein
MTWSMTLPNGTTSSMHEGAGDGNPLLLATGMSRRPFARLLQQPDPREQFPGAGEGLARRHSLNAQRNGDVLGRGEGRDQVELLKNEADIQGTELGDFPRGQLMNCGRPSVFTAPASAWSVPQSTESSVVLPHRPWGQHYSYAFEVQPSMRSWFAG